MSNLLNQVGLAFLGAAIGKLHSSARAVATFPIDLILDRRPDNVAEVNALVGIVEKAKEFVVLLDEAKKIVTVQPDAAKPAPAPAAETGPASLNINATKGSEADPGDTCQCTICQLRRSLTGAPKKAAVPTSSLDILFEMILGKAEPPAPKAEAASAAKGNA